MTINLRPWIVSRWLLAAAACLIGAHIVLQFGFHRYLGHESVLGLVRAFDVDREFNLPSFFSGLLLLYCALLLHLVARISGRADPFGRHWRLLGWLFVFLAADEVLAIHERLSKPMQDLFDTSGLFAFAWIIPYGLAVIVLGIVLLPFLRSLPLKTRGMFVAAAAVFLSGALGLEALGGRELEAAGEKTLHFAWLATAEEGLEMSGLILFSHALLQHITRLVPAFSLRLTATGKPEPAAEGLPTDRPSSTPLPSGEALQ